MRVLCDSILPIRNQFAENGAHNNKDRTAVKIDKWIDIASVCALTALRTCPGTTFISSRQKFDFLEFGGNTYPQMVVGAP